MKKKLFSLLSVLVLVAALLPSLEARAATSAVSFAVTPAQAEVEVKNSTDVVQNPRASDRLTYDLEPGDYTYTVSATDYYTNTGSLSVEDSSFLITVELNASQPQAVNVSLTVTGDTAGYVGTVFDLSLSSLSTPGLSFQLAHSQTYSVNIPAGEEVTVSATRPADPASYVYDPPEISPARFTVPVGGQNVAVAMNLREVVDANATVTVTGETAAYAAASNPAFGVILTPDVGNPVPKSWLSGAPGNSFAFQLGKGRSYTTAVEPPAIPGYVWDVPVVSPDPLVPDGSNTLAIIMNLRRQTTPDPPPRPPRVEGERAGHDSGWVQDEVKTGLLITGGGVWTGGDLAFTAEGVMPAGLRGVTIDLAALDRAHYMVKAGSCIVTIRESYLRTLAPGEHVLGLEFAEHRGSKVFTVGTQRVPALPEAEASTPQDSYNPNTGL